jgi:hypothetical protein
LDRKLREEKVLREKADARVADLRKKLRDMKGENATAKVVDQNSPEEQDPTCQQPELRCTDKTGGTSIAANKDVATVATPNVTPVKVKPTSTNASSLQSPSIQSISSDVTRKAGTSIANNQTKDGNRETAGSFLTQLASTDTARKAGSSLNLTPQVDGSRKAGSSLPLPATAGAGLTVSKGTAAPSPLKTASKNDHGQPCNVETQKNDASFRMVNSLGGKDGETLSRASIKDNSPSNAGPILSQQVWRNNDGIPLAPARRAPNEIKGHRQTHSLHDFDPLSSNGNTTISDTMVISLPTSYSLEAVPVNSNAPAGRMPLNEIDGTFMAQNQFVVPLTFQMTSAPLGTSGVNSEQHSSTTNVGQTVMANDFNGFQQQQFMVLPQQQPIMFQQLHQVQDNNWPQNTTYPNQPGTNYTQVQFPGQQPHFQQQQQANLQHQQQQQQPTLQQQQQQFQHQIPQQSHPQQNASNPFDPLSSR